VATPLVLFTYLNPLLSLGRRPAGVDAALVLDPADDEEVPLLDGLDRIRLAAPSTTEARLRAIGERAGSFVYYVSRYGVTGARAALPPGLAADVERVRALARRPVAVGFGISSPEQASAVARIADGVVVGSAIVERIEKGGRASVGDVRAFTAEIAAAVHGARP
jgi:tryptophan synthase alpha chain